MMVLVSQGSFAMGAKPSESGLGGPAITGVATEVGAFYLDECEVSNHRFELFVSATKHRTDVEVRDEGTVFRPSDPRHPAPVKGANWRRPTANGEVPQDWERLPVVLASWDDASSYAAWVNCDLPTEVQFEFAARAGLKGALYPWGDDLPPGRVLGNLPDASLQRAFPVGRGEVNTWFMPGYDDGHATSSPCASFAANALGIYDLEGNVMEWCRDSDPKDPNGRAARGGSWRSRSAEWLRVSERHFADRQAASDEVGFRCAKAVVVK